MNSENGTSQDLQVLRELSAFQWALDGSSKNEDDREIVLGFIEEREEEEILASRDGRDDLGECVGLNLLESALNETEDIVDFLKGDGREEIAL